MFNKKEIQVSLRERSLANKKYTYNQEKKI